MKKFTPLLCTICLSLLASASFAQTERGAMFAEKATMSVTPSKGLYAISVQEAITAQAQFGYFYQRNLAIGANVQLTPPYNALTLLSLRGNVAAFTRYYFDTPIPQLKPYGQGNIAYSQGKNTNNVYETRMGFSGQVGVSYFTSKVAGIDINMTGLGLDAVTSTAGTRVQGIYPSWSALKFNVGLMLYMGGRNQPNPPKPGPNNNNNNKPKPPVPKKPTNKPSSGGTQPKKPLLKPAGK